MKFEFENDFYRLIYFVGNWELVSLKMIECEFGVLNKTMYRKIASMVKQNFFKKIRLNFTRQNKPLTINAYYLSKKGYAVLLDHWPQIKLFSKSNISPIALEHNYICLQVLKHHLKLTNPYRYFLPNNTNTYKINKLKNQEITAKGVLNKYKFSKSCDFIYLKQINGFDYKIAGEVELTRKANNRYYGDKNKETVFSKLNNDYSQGLFNKVEYYVPKKLYSVLKPLFDNTPSQYKLKMPYEFFILEEILPDFSLEKKLSFKKPVSSSK